MQVSQIENNFIIPYHYPAMIVLTMIVIAGAFIASLEMLPRSIESVKELHIGIDMYNRKNYSESIKYLELVLQKNPESETAKIAIAKAYFANKDPKISIKGLYYLENIRLNNDQWNELTEVMPPEYNEYCSNETKGKYIQCTSL